MFLANKTVGLVVIIGVYIISCAQQTSPTGGPKDENPPILQSSTPENKSLNFSGNKIVLKFDEYIKTNNPREEIIIIPSLPGEYETSYRKKTFFLKIKDTLQSNTTYTFNFREGIQDLNESNSPKNLQLILSTGNYLDSLSIAGNVAYLLNGKPMENVTISLYDAKDTLNVLNSPPVYFTKSDASGDFIFTNLKNGKYSIYALQDENKNLVLESKNEQYSYLDYNIALSSNISDLKLHLVNVDITPLKLQSARTRGHYYVLKYNKYISMYHHRLISNNREMPKYSLSEDHREIIYYNSNTIVDSLGIVVNAYDTINNLATDTVYVKFEKTKRSKSKFELAYSKISIDKTKPLIDVEISFSKPISTINLDSIYFQIDSTKQISLDSTLFVWNKTKTLLTIEEELDKKLFETPEEIPETQDSVKLQKKLKKNLTKNNETRFYFGKGAFLSIEQDTSTVHIENVSLTNTSTTGSILVEIETTANSFFTQLLNENDKIVSEKYSEKVFSFDNVPPGKYTIRILVDQNGNKQWEIGNMMKAILPEPVVFYKSKESITEIIIRANWVLGPNIIKF